MRILIGNTRLSVCKLFRKTMYFSVPNRRVGRNKRAGGKILKKH